MVGHHISGEYKVEKEYIRRRIGIRRLERKGGFIFNLKTDLIGIFAAAVAGLIGRPYKKGIISFRKTFGFELDPEVRGGGGWKPMNIIST